VYTVLGRFIGGLARSLGRFAAGSLAARQSQSARLLGRFAASRARERVRKIEVCNSWASHA
jgi:hypothetical protein